MAVDVGRVFALLAAKGTEEARAASCGHSSRQGLPRGPGTGNVRGADAGLRGETAGGPRSATRVRAFRGPRTAVGDAPWPRVPQRVFAGSPARPWAGEGRSGGPASSLEEERLGCRLPWAFSPCSPSTGAKLSLSLF